MTGAFSVGLVPGVSLDALGRMPACESWSPVPGGAKVRWEDVRDLG